MKFFEMKTNSDWKHAPRLVDWYGHFDVRDIRLETFFRLPKNELFFVAPLEQMEFTDIVSFPFLLISPTIRDVIEMYGEKAWYCDIILLNQKSGESELYYLPVIEEFENIHFQYKDMKKSLTSQSTHESEIPDLVKKRNIFWTRKSGKRCTIISLDFAESILRRNVKGVGLREVYFEKENERRV